MASRRVVKASNEWTAERREALLRSEMLALAEGLVRANDAGRSSTERIDVMVRIALQHTRQIAVDPIPDDFPRDRYDRLARMYVFSDYLDGAERIFAGTLKVDKVPAFARELMVFSVLAFLEARQIELHKAGALIGWLHQEERTLPYRLRGRAGAAKRPSQANEVAERWSKLATQRTPERERAGIIAARTGLTDRAVRKIVAKKRLRKAGT